MERPKRVCSLLLIKTRLCLSKKYKHKAEPLDYNSVTFYEFVEDVPLSDLRKYFRDLRKDAYAADAEVFLFLLISIRPLRDKSRPYMGIMMGCHH